MSVFCTRMAATELGPVDPARVTTTYNGRVGCACGCRGTYAESGPAVTKRVAVLNRHLDEVTAYVYANEVIYEWEHGEDRVTRAYVERTY